MTKRILNKEDILKASDFKSVEVEIKEWGGSVFVRTMSGFERDEFEASVIGKNGSVNHKNIRAKLLVRCICDESGKLLFSEHDITTLGQKSSKAIDRLFSIAQALNGIGDKEVEELLKNS